MPLYDYECAECAHVFEVFHKVDEESKNIVCPKCGAKKSKKLISHIRSHSWSQFLDNMEKKISPHKFK